MNGGAWKAAVHGVAKSRTRLKRLSSSSSLKKIIFYIHIEKKNSEMYDFVLSAGKHSKGTFRCFFFKNIT